jgi:hypothetical protein
MGFVVLKLLRQHSMGMPRLGQNEHAAAVAIEAMHHPQARLARRRTSRRRGMRSKICLRQVDNRRLRGIPSVWDHQQAGGFIEHQEVIIFMQHL